MRGRPETATAVGGHWSAVASSWHHVGAPLRPSAEDLAFVHHAAARAASEGGCRRVVVLGVTAELAELGWPAGAQVLAVDHTAAMVTSIWPAKRGPALLGEWTALPLAPGRVDVVAGDGMFHLLDPAAQHRFAAELAGVLRPGGLAALRLFLPPPDPEAVADVLADFCGGRVRDLNELKLRLWMAMRIDRVEGVRLDDVWQAVAEVAGSDPDAFAASIGWDADHLASLGSYRGSDERYHLVGLQTAVATLQAAGESEVVDVRVPGHERGAQCPTLVARRTGDSR